jgi:uncharacterized protein YggE
MKDTTFLMAIAGVLVVASLWWTQPMRTVQPGGVAVAQAQAAPTRTVHTTGTAVIRVQPDKATVRLGVQTFGPAPRESRARNVQIVEQVLQAIRGEGVPVQDIATDYLTIRPENDYKQFGESKIVGYWTDNAIVVTLRDVDKLSDVLTAALEAGATTVDDISFSTTRLRELRDEARSLAVEAAMEKAQALSGAVNVSVGDVQDISENSWSYYSGIWNSRGQWTANAVQNVMQVASSPNAPQPDDGEFSLGQIVVQAQVELTVAIR